MHRFLITGCLLALFALGGTLPVEAAGISRQQAASIAQSQFAGRVIGVSEENSSGTLIYKVRVLDKDGGMHIVIIDGTSGKIISAH